MKSVRLLISVSIFLVLFSNLFAGENQTKEEQKEKSKFGLIFSFSGLDQIFLSEFNGGVGAKYYLSSKLAVRNVIDLDLSTTTGENISDSDRFLIRVRPGLEYHFKGRNIISPYFGGEIMFERFSLKQTFFNNDTEIIRNDDSISFGGNVYLGFEIYPVNFFSLGGEYSISLVHRSFDSEEQSGGTVVKTEFDSVSVNTNSSRLVIFTFYF